LKKNLKKVGLSMSLVDIIMDSYNEVFVRIWNQGEASNPIPIKKGGKQGCLLNPLLFNICFDPIFSYIMRPDNHKYIYKLNNFHVTYSSIS
jgi:hypothetical protein